MLAVVVAGSALSACSVGTPPDAAPSSSRVLVALELTRNTSGLASLANSVSDPDSPDYHHFQQLSKVAKSFGASSSTIATDLKVLRNDGLDLRADPTHGALWGTISPVQAAKYFGTTLVQDDGMVEPLTQPQVPAGLRGVSAVIGLVASTASTSPTAGGTPAPPCPSTLPSRASVAQLFGFTDFLTNDSGAGTSMDILAIHGFEPAVFTNYNRCAHATLSPDHIDNLSVPGAPQTTGGPEIALDSLIMTLLAPETQLHVIHFDPLTSLAFPLMELLGSQAPPNVLDITVTYCSTQVTRAEQSLSEWLLAALAVTGTTTLAAAGDSGSSGCAPNTDKPLVTYPASSAFVVGIGGVSYMGSATDPIALTTWNTVGLAGGGGGTSSTVAAPPWQPPGGRRVPDVSAFAVPGGVGAIPVCTSDQDCQWLEEGGTSLGATVVGAAGLLLAQAASTAGVSARWGNIAAPLWRRAGHDPAIVDVTTGSNKTFATGCCQAGPGYDQATGWGLFVPNSLSGLFTDPA